MSEHDHATEVLDTEPTHHAEHIVGPKVYGIIFGLLLIFTASTVGASYLELGTFNAVVALGIAVIKAVLVILFFMHVKYASEKLTKMVIVASIFWLLLLLLLSLADYGTRYARHG